MFYLKVPDKKREIISFLYFVVFLKLCEARIESWTGRWLPERVTENPVLNKQIHTGEMGLKSNHCDDGKTNLTLDWDGSKEQYLCMNPRNLYVPDYKIKPVIRYENIPSMYKAQHFCMDTPIYYDRAVPTFGPHRPLWPVYGEYLYVPKQRWIHSLEHGAIVMLYHPCADPYEVKTLKYYVRTCLRRHVITPSVELDEDRPLELVAWGVRLSMSAVNSDLVKQFIQENALKGPEKLSEEGQFSDYLISRALPVSDVNDTRLCPRVPTRD